MGNIYSYITVVLFVVGASWYTIDSAYEHGRKIEKLAWMEREDTLKRKADIRVKQAEAKIRMDKELADTRVTKIIGAYANEIEKLSADLTDAADHRLYITAKAASCESGRNSMPSSDKSSGQTVAEIRFEIPAALGRAIRGDYFTAAGIEMRYNMLVDLIESRPDCFEKVR